MIDTRQIVPNRLSNRNEIVVDHHVIDGAVAAGFFRRVQRYIEKPIALLDNKK